MKTSCVLAVGIMLAGICGCCLNVNRPSGERETTPFVVLNPDKNPPPGVPTSASSTAALIADLKGPAPDRMDWAQARAAVIDLLAERKAREAVPALIECLTDHRGLEGSDNWVGGHAANALTAITGRPFSVDQKEWKTWWRLQERGGPPAHTPR